jgi:hypothetical protein
MSGGFVMISSSVTRFNRPPNPSQEYYRIKRTQEDLGRQIDIVSEGMKTIQEQKEEAIALPDQFKSKIEQIQNVVRNWKGEFPHNYKIAICKKILQKGFCTYGNKCQFAHTLVTNYALRLLDYEYFKQKICPDEINCNYNKLNICGNVHDGDLMQRGKNWRNKGWEIYGSSKENQSHSPSPVSFSPIPFSKEELEDPSCALALRVYDDLELEPKLFQTGR